MLRPLIGLAGCRTVTVNSPYKAFPSSRRGVHLLRLIDDQGNKLIAASKNRFEVIC
jgi:hypothetical protein